MSALPKDAVELRKLVLANGGVIETNARALRAARAAGRLGCHVRSGISDWLRQAELKCWPEIIPNDQGQRVLVYAASTDRGHLMDIALRGLR